MKLDILELKKTHVCFEKYESKGWRIQRYIEQCRKRNFKKILEDRNQLHSEQHHRWILPSNIPVKHLKAAISTFNKTLFQLKEI